MTPKPGIYPGVDFATYRSWEAVNWHTLWCMIEHSAAHALSELREGGAETEALAFGRLTHWVLLEPGEFQEKAAVEPEIGGEVDGQVVPKRPTKTQLNARNPSKDSIAAIEYWAKWDAYHERKIIVKRADYDQVLEIESAIRAAQCREYIVSGRAEVCILWRDRKTGLLCKARLDYERMSGFNHYITDVKGARSAREDHWQAAVFNRGYDGQMAYYHDGWLAADPDHNTSICWWLVPEKTKPFVCKPWQAHEDWLESGRNLYRPALDRWAEHVKANDFPAYGGAEILKMPDWAKQRRGVGPDLIRPEPQTVGSGITEGQESSEFDEFMKG